MRPNHTILGRAHGWFTRFTLLRWLRTELPNSEHEIDTRRRAVVGVGGKPRHSNPWWHIGRNSRVGICGVPDAAVG